MNKDQVFQLVGKAKRAFPEWKKDYGKRRSYIYNLVEYLKKNKTELAKTATAEMGKVLKESIGEVEKCAWALEFYADHGDSFLSDDHDRFRPPGRVRRHLDLRPDTPRQAP